MSLQETDKFSLQEHILISTPWGLTYEATIERLTDDHLPKRVKIVDSDLFGEILNNDQFSVIARLK